MALTDHPPALAGIVAAGLLADACRMAPEDDLRARTVEDLVRDLGQRLGATRGMGGEDGLEPLVEAALACGDLATLAACNVSGLPSDARPLATAATHLAAGTARALLALAEVEAADPHDTYAAYALRDARGAGWKADLAVRQLPDAGGPG